MSGGLSVVDIMNLPPVERRIMQLMMRSGSMTYPQLRDAVATMPADECPDEGKLRATLDHLMQEHWLIHEVTGQQTAYRPCEIRRASARSSNLWQKLEGTDIHPPETCLPASPKTTSGGKRNLPTKLWDCLLDDKEQ